MKPAALLALLLASCAGADEPPLGSAATTAAADVTAAPTPAPALAPAAPGPVDVMPQRGDGPPLPAADRILTRIALGSCSEETEPLPILGAVAGLAPDLFLMVGDNVYGDAEAGDMNLPELRKAYGDLAMNAHFSAFTMATPMLATWDDHDYGQNDAGADFPARDLSERLFETFWRDSGLGGDHPGVYGARTFGPPGRRVQVVMLDTRYFRSPLTRSETPNEAGYRPYLPDPDPAKTMLGEAQWSWLEAELRKPAEIRLIVSSVQVLADGHPFEAWKTLPREQQRLFEVIRRTSARGVVLLSGDRHLGALYRRKGVAPYALHELTASSLNRSHGRPGVEQATHQIGGVYTPENFGLIEIDWAKRSLALTVRGMDGAPQRRLDLRFEALGLAP